MLELLCEDDEPLSCEDHTEPSDLRTVDSAAFLSAVLCMMCMCLIAQARVHLTHVHIHVYLFARGVQCRGHLVITLAPCAYRGISRVFRVQLLQFAVTERTQLFSRTWQSH